MLLSVLWNGERRPQKLKYLYCNGCQVSTLMLYLHVILWGAEGASQCYNADALWIVELLKWNPFTWVQKENTSFAARRTHLRYWPACGKHVFYRPNTITSPGWMRDSTPVVQPQICRPARSRRKTWLITRDVLGVIMQTQSHAARDQKEKSAKGWKKQSLSQAETVSFSLMLLLLWCCFKNVQLWAVCRDKQLLWGAVTSKQSATVRPAVYRSRLADWLHQSAFFKLRSLAWTLRWTGQSLAPPPFPVNASDRQ